MVTAQFHRSQSDGPAAIPLQYTEWRGNVARTSLNNLANPDTWLATWAALGDYRTPDAPAMARLATGGPKYSGRLALRGTIYRSLEGCPGWASTRTGHFRPWVDFRNNNATIPGALRAPTVDLTDIGIEYEHGKREICQPTDFEKLGPAASASALLGATPRLETTIAAYAGGWPRRISPNRFAEPYPMLLPVSHAAMRSARY